MAYFDTELAVPPPVTITTPEGGTAELQEKPGMGYPTGGPLGSATYPGMPVLSQDVANTPDEFPAVIAEPPATPFAYAYSFQTLDEKTAAMVPPGVPVVPVDVEPNEPYPVS
jgi:hypothetical protein